MLSGQFLWLWQQWAIFWQGGAGCQFVAPSARLLEVRYVTVRQRPIDSSGRHGLVYLKVIRDGLVRDVFLYGVSVFGQSLNRVRRLPDLAAQ
jgi:hypothetical protein